jgi:hypothetical protein
MKLKKIKGELLHSNLLGALGLISSRILFILKVLFSFRESFIEIFFYK